MAAKLKSNWGVRTVGSYLLVGIVASCGVQPRAAAGAPKSGAAAQVAVSAQLASGAPAPTPAPAPAKGVQSVSSILAASRSEKEGAALAAQWSAEARLTARAAVKAWFGPDPETAGRAHAYLKAIDDLSIVPLLEQRAPESAALTVDVLRLATDAEVAAQGKIMQRATQLLTDQRHVPTSAGLRDAEETPAEHRVCDDAYAAMRRINRFGEDRVRGIAALDGFFRSPEARRDQLIAAARRAPDFRADTPAGGDSPGRGGLTPQH